MTNERFQKRQEEWRELLSEHTVVEIRELLRAFPKYRRPYTSQLNKAGLVQATARLLAVQDRHNGYRR